MKNMGKDFIVGYAFNDLDRKFVKAIKGDQNKSALEKSRSYSINTHVPLCWFTECRIDRATLACKSEIASSSSRVREVIEGLKAIFADTAVGHNFSFDITSSLDEDRYVKITLDMDRNLKELTMKELEKIVGYPFKIVEEKEEKKHIAFVMAQFAWNDQEEI